MAWLLPAIAVLLAPLVTNDLAYLIPIGDRIADTGTIPHHDVLTYTVAGQPWVFQQWLAAVVFGRLHAWIGWQGAVVMRAVLVAISFGTTYRRTRTASRNPTVAGCLVFGCFLSVAAFPGTLELRPQLLVAPLFVLVCWLIDGRTVHPRRTWWVVPVAIAWANLHGSVLLVAVLAVLALIGDLVRRRRTASMMAAITVGALMAPMLTPWGWRTYAYIWDVASSPVVRAIDEWRPIMVRWPAGLVFGVMVIALGVVLWRRRTAPFDVESCLGLIVVTALVLISGRNVIWWALYVPPVVGRLTGSRERSTSGSETTERMIAVALVALLALGTWRVLVAERDEDLLADAPPGVTRALADRTDLGRVFAADWAGWFEYTFPGTPMFVDARAELFPAEVWDSFFEVVTGGSDWRDVLSSWNVQVVIFDDTLHPALASVIATDPGWRLAYADEDGRIYVRA